MDSDASQSAGFYSFLAWLEVNKKRLLVGAAVLAVLALIATILIHQSAQKELEASQALSELRTAYPTGTPLPAGAAASYLTLAQKHSGTKAGARAMLQAAGILFAENQLTEAQTQFERFLREYPDSPWVGSAVFGVAAALEAQQKTKEATAKFEEFRRRFTHDALNEEAKLSLARLYKAQNRNEDAFKLYDEVTKGNPYGGLGAEAGMRLMDLVQKHPELVKTNEPVLANLPPTATPTLPSTTNKIMTTLTNVIRQVATNISGQAATNLVTTNAAPLLLKPAVPAGKP